MKDVMALAEELAHAQAQHRGGDQGHCCCGCATIAARKLSAGNDIVEECYGSDDFREGVAAFVEARLEGQRPRSKTS